jgi:hypothetical protein
LGCVQIAPGTMNPGEVNIGNPSLVMSHVFHSRNGHA